MKNNQNKNKKKNFSKRRAVKNNNDGRQDLDQVGRGNLRVYAQKRGLIIPDMYTQKILYATSQQNIFNTAATVGSISWNINDLRETRTTVTPTVLSGVTSSTGIVLSDACRYRRYRVLDAKFKIRLQSREATNPQTYLLHPSSVLPNVALNTEFSWLMMQQSNCIRTLGPIGSGNACQDLTMRYNPEKIFGEHYHQQDEYTGTITGALGAQQFTSPTTLAYMGLSFHNTNTNTLTTGGAVMTVQVILNVLFYDVDRDEDPLTYKTVDQTVDEIEKQISQLKLRAKQLTRETSK